MKNLKSVLRKSIIAFAVAMSSVAGAESISRHVVDGFEDWYWTTKITVKRGEAHTFWITDLTPDTVITSFEVYCDFTYKDSGETYEDSVWCSETTDIENAAGGYDMYALFPAEDWDWVDSSVKSLAFTVKVSGWGDDEFATSADKSFKFHHSVGDSDYPGQVTPPEPVYVAPKGAVDNPQTITIKETALPSGAATTDCKMASDLHGTFYIKTPNLLAGRKYFFGISDGTSMSLSPSTSGSNMFENEDYSKPYDGFAKCAEAYSFVAPAAGAYWIVVESSSDFKFYGALAPALTPDKHQYVDLAVGTSSEEFAPGYMNDPEGGAYDEVIDQQLFRVTGYKKGDNIVFRTDGASCDLLMRLYDSKGNILAESTRAGDDSLEVSVAWTATAAYAAASAVYLGVCQQLEDGEEPSASEVTVAADIVSVRSETTPLPVIPDAANGSPVDAEGAEPSADRSLSADEWVNTFVIAARNGVTYRIKAECDDTLGLALGASVYTLSGATKKPLTAAANSLSGSLDPEWDGWLEFTASANGNVYIDVFVENAELDYGYNKSIGYCAGLEYGPYRLYASVPGDSFGIMVAPMKGAPQDLMGWKILSGPGITANKEVFYAAGTSAIVPAGKYTLVAQTVKGFATPDAKGYATVDVVAGETATAKEYKYTDTADPLDDSPDAKAKHPDLKKAYVPTKLAPTAAKPATADRTLWDNDEADWYTIAASTPGSFYRFKFAEKTGAPRMAIFGPDSWTKECDYDLLDDPESALQFCAAKKGTYYVKVSHLDDGDRIDSSYTLEASMANPGVVKLAKTDIAAKDSAAYVDLSVSRTGKDGIVRVKYRTAGSQTDKDDAYYYPTNGILTWAANDNKAQTIRVKLVPGGGWTGNKTVKVVFEPFSTDDETFNPATEFPAKFDSDKNGKLLDTATITISSSAKKAPGTIQAVCEAPKKPVFTVKAGELAEIPLERVLGADGVVGVKVETVKGTANKSGTTDFTPIVDTIVWEDGETDQKTVCVETKAVDGDFTGVKTFTLKLTAVTSAKTDPVQYEKPTIAAASVTVNIVNEKFADTLANYTKANAAILKAQGVAFKEGKAGTWFIDDDGGLFTAAGSDITFTLAGPGKFVFVPEGDGVTASTGSGKAMQTVECPDGEEASIYVASGSQSVVIKKASAIRYYEWTSLAPAVAAAPTLDKAVLAKGVNELCFERQDGVSYRVYALSAGAKAERTVNGKTTNVTLKLGDPETEIFDDGEGRFFVDCEYNTTNKGKYTWRVDAYYEDSTITNVSKTAWNLTILDAEPYEVPATAVSGVGAWGEEVEGAGSAEVVLRQGVKASFAVGEAGSTVKSVSGKLPDGLKLEQDKTTKQWFVRGTPSKAGTFQALLQETDAKKVAGTTTVLDIAVEAAGTSVGTFNGLATTFDTTNGVPSLASVAITATAAGKLSAKVMIAGKAYSFADTGYSYVAGDPDDPEAPAYVSAELFLVSKVGTGKTAVTVTNWLYYTVMDVPEANPDGWYAEGVVDILMAALPDAKGNGFQEDVWYSGKTYRDNSKIADKAALAEWKAEAAKYAGYYTVSLVAPDAMPGEPRGSGYMTMTLDAAGKAKLAGKLADGTAYSGSATAALVGDAYWSAVRVPLYAQKGTSVFGGWLSIRENDEGDVVAEIDSPDTDVVWINDDPASTRAGEEGFVLYLQPVGGWYDTVSNLQRSYLESDLAVNLPEGEDALEEIMEALALDGDYAFAAQPSGQAVDVAGDTLSVEKQTLVKDAAKKMNDWDASANASNVKLTFKRATGIVSGTFDLWYEGENAKGVKEQKSIAGLKHEGVLVTMRGDDGYLEDDVLSSGFFLAPQTIVTEVTTISAGRETTKKVSRKWNGSYRFDINATPADRTWMDYLPEGD